MRFSGTMAARWAWGVAVLASIAAAGGCQGRPEARPLPGASAECIEKSIRYLTSESLEGRGPGTVGIDLAADYIAGYFRGLGLASPPGQAGFEQAFTRTVMRGVSGDSRLSLGGQAVGRNDWAAMGPTGEGAFAGPVVFAGYGVRGPGEKAYDDYEGVDLGGKVALVMRFEPQVERGQSRLAKTGWSAEAELSAKAQRAAAAGAVALLVVHPPNGPGREEMARPPQGPAQRARIPVVQVRQRVVEEMLNRAGAPSLGELQRTIDASFSPRSFMLGRTRAEGRVAFDRREYVLRNVWGYLPGRGRLAKEVVVIGAHYDHLGYGHAAGATRASATRPAYYPGADDNASGTAAMLELARIFAEAGSPGRSLLFVAFSGEELGLVGSQHWMEHAPVPVDHVAAMVNFDMVGRLRNDTVYVGGTGTGAGFEQTVRRADEASRLEVKELWRDGKAPSDSLTFVNREIPVLFFWTGMHFQLHRPADSADTINFAGEAEVVNLAAVAIEDLTRKREVRFTRAGPGPFPEGGPVMQQTEPASAR